jgi:hypothetical protein
MVHFEVPTRPGSVCQTRFREQQRVSLPYSIDRDD